MKRMLSKVPIVICIILLSLISISPIYGNRYNTEYSEWNNIGYWNNDTNYPCVFYNDKVHYFLDKSSIIQEGNIVYFTIRDVYIDNTSGYMYYVVKIEKDDEGYYHIYDLKHNGDELYGCIYEEPVFSASYYIINYLDL